MPELDGRRFVVTGASRGIGRVIVRHLADRGASITLVARDQGVLEAIASALPGEAHETVALDVRDREGWWRWAESAGPIDGLVTAAGVIGPIGPIGTWSIDEFRTTFDINVAGTLLAIEACLPAITATGGSVVTLSGGGAASPLPRFDAYASSKAAVSRLAENLARDLAPRRVRVNSVAPGFIVTEMHEATLAAGPELVGDEYFQRTKRAVDQGGGDPPELAARLTEFLLSLDAEGITGKLISARWDPWEDDEFRQRLRNDADFCTVRRIDAQFFDRAPSR